MAARRFEPGERVLDIRSAEQVEGYEVQSQRVGEAPSREVVTDTAPGAFVDRLAGESGEVRVAPILDMVRARLRQQREAEAKTGT